MPSATLLAVGFVYAIIFQYNSKYMSCLGKNKARWFPIAFLVVFDTEFSFSSWWAAFSKLIPHHTVKATMTLMHRLNRGWYGFNGGWIHHRHIFYMVIRLHSLCNLCQRTHSTKRCEVRNEGDMEMFARPTRRECGHWRMDLGGHNCILVLVQH